MPTPLMGGVRKKKRCRSLRGCRNVSGSAIYQMLRHCGHSRVSFPTSAPARVAITQIKLTQEQVEEFIAAQKDMSAVVEKMMQGAAFSNSANARYEAELKAVTKKHGFKNFAEYEAVTASVSLVRRRSIRTKVFTDPPRANLASTRRLEAFGCRANCRRRYSNPHGSVRHQRSSNRSTSRTWRMAVLSAGIQ